MKRAAVFLVGAAICLPLCLFAQTPEEPSSGGWIHSLIVFMANPWYRYGFLTFIATLVSLIVKLVSRPDGVKTQVEDFAVGLDLAQVAIFTVLSDGVADVVHTIVVEKRRQFDLRVVEHLVAMGPVLAAMIFFLFMTTLFVRKHGWQYVGREWRLTFLGAFAPLPVGLLYIALAILFVGGE